MDFLARALIASAFLAALALGFFMREREPPGMWAGVTREELLTRGSFGPISVRAVSGKNPELLDVSLRGRTLRLHVDGRVVWTDTNWICFEVRTGMVWFDLSRPGGGPHHHKSRARCSGP